MKKIHNRSFFTLLSITILICLSRCGNHTSRSELSSPPAPTIRLAFGSCNDEERPQPLWGAILAERPDLWLWLGDNIYADTERLAEMQAQYDHLNATPGYQQLKQAVPIDGTWDDHDYGENDGGKNYSLKAGSQQLFLDFIGIPVDDPLRFREGIYHSRLLSKDGLTIQLLALDTRYFRDDLAGKKGSYKPTEGTILGVSQWNWLEEELEKSQADVHVFLSSIQLIASNHGWEKWGNFPTERKRFLELLVDKKVKYPIVLSGDRHMAEICAIELSNGSLLYDITSSSLNKPIPGLAKSKNQQRALGTSEEIKANYGLLDIRKNGSSIQVTAKIKTGVDSTSIHQQIY